MCVRVCVCVCNHDRETSSDRRSTADEVGSYGGPRLNVATSCSE